MYRTALSDLDVAATAEAEPLRGIPAEQAQAAAKVLKNLIRQRFAAPFLDPVSEQAVPGYHAIVQQPQDLTSILQGLESNAYPSLGHHLLYLPIAITSPSFSLCQPVRLQGHAHNGLGQRAPDHRCIDAAMMAAGACSQQASTHAKGPQKVAEILLRVDARI